MRIGAGSNPHTPTLTLQPKRDTMDRLHLRWLDLEVVISLNCI